MSGEKEPYCILGNGTCPTECRLYENAVAITSVLGDKFDPVKSRKMIVLADAFNHDIDVVQVAAVMAKCIKEPKVSKKE